MITDWSTVPTVIPKMDSRLINTQLVFLGKLWAKFGYILVTMSNPKDTAARAIYTTRLPHLKLAPRAVNIIRQQVEPLNEFKGGNGE